MTIDPCSAYEWVCAPSWRRESARFMDPLLIWIAGGRGRAWIGDPAVKYELGPGDIMIIPKNLAHSILPGKGETMRLIIVHVYIRVFGSADIFHFLGLSGVFNANDRKTTDRCFTELAREYAHKTFRVA